MTRLSTARTWLPPPLHTSATSTSGGGGHCPLLIELLTPYYVKWPIPKFYEWLHLRVLPQLEPMEREFEERATAPRVEIERRLREVFAKIR
jgi:hypothetical protein